MNCTNTNAWNDHCSKAAGHTGLCAFDATAADQADAADAIRNNTGTALRNRA